MKKNGGSFIVLFGALLLPALVFEARGQTSFEPYAISTFAGVPQRGGYYNGVGTRAPYLNRPLQMVQDTAGNILFCDEQNDIIRKISPDGSVSIFAGALGEEGTTDGALLDARFSEPSVWRLTAAGTFMSPMRKVAAFARSRRRGW